MQKYFTDLIQRLTSRKFLLALGAAITAFGQGYYTQGLAILAGYIGVEGLVDAVTAWQAGQTARHNLTLKTIDNDGRIVPGGFNEATDDPIQPGTN